MWKKVAKLVLLWLLMGMAYFLVEIAWRLPRGGWPHWSMLLVGGLCGVAVGGINQIPRFYNMKIVWQSLIGAAITLFVEFAAGCVLNLWLGLGIWSYANMPLNLLGQICVPFALVWFVIMPFAIWLEDILRWGFWQDGKPYSLWRIYLDFITGR